MKLGPIEIVTSPNPGIWLTVNDGTRRDVTFPSIAITAALFLLFCCCARIVF